MSDGRRLQITHHTGFRYATDVAVSFNEVRMTPLSGEGQTLLNHQLLLEPASRLHSYVDYWGAVVEWFEIHIPHRILEITSTSLVDTPPMPEWGGGGSWEGLRNPISLDAFGEFLQPTHYVDSAMLGGDVAKLVKDLRTSETPEEAARGCIEAVRSRLSYESGRTDVSTTASQAWAAGHGVCQDFSHTALVLLRALGIPARYVSGYLHTEEPAVGQTVIGESHAWVEYWDDGWHAYDPTNNRAVGAAHVVVARGRDYADVPPLKGIFAGGPSEGLGVTVEITQV